MRKLTDFAFSMLSPKARAAYQRAEAARADRAARRAWARSEHPAVSSLKMLAARKRQRRGTRNLAAVAAGGMLAHIA